MPRLSLLTPALALVALAASAPPRASEPLACSITLSGAQTGTLSCIASAAFDAARNESIVTIMGGNANLVVKMKGAPAAQRYASGDARSGCGFMVRTPAGAYWYFNREFTKPGTPSGGSYELTLTSASPGTTAGNTKVFNVSGSLHTKLPAGAVGGATGQVDVTVNF
jgi:hypothetical protein